MKRTEPLAKSLVTVKTIRAANVKIMASTSGLVSTAATPAPQVVVKIRDLAAAGRFAMESLKK